MQKRFLSIAAGLSGAAFAVVITPSASAGSLTGVSADPTTFTGVCTFSGTATLTPPIGATPITSTYTFTSDGSSTNQCSGTISNGTTVSHAFAAQPASVGASGSGTLSCAVSESTNDTGTLTISGTDINGNSFSTPITFNLTIVGIGPEVTVVATGTAGGAATGQASFATDTTAATKCTTNSAGRSNFLVAVAGRLSG